MIGSAYARLMARYNMWQNKSLRDAMQEVSERELFCDRGAFFGSIFATANHLLWGDILWMSRFDGGDPPPSAPGSVPRMGITESVGLTADLAEWESLRSQTDSRICTWANSVEDGDLTGDLTWYSGAAGREISKARALCVTHFFNHQTHHRGQIHAMLTAAGARPDDTDLFLLPEAV